VRTKPYTAIGIRRKKCIRFAVCGNMASTQWQICADGRQYRPVCADCDVELNALVLAWGMIPDGARKIRLYREKVLGA